jgi:beta-glucosidase
VDVDMMSHFYDAELPGLIRSGRVSMAAVDESVRRVLRVKFALGLFDNPYPTRPEITAADPQNRPLVRQAAEESFVLLQNKSVAGVPLLPLRANLKIALIGPMADNANEMDGAWSGASRAEDAITLRTALQEHASAHGGSVVYVQGTGIISNTEAGFAAAEAAARQADVVVMALGESGAMSGEAGSRAHLDLPGNQQALLETITAVGKPVVLLLFSGRPLVLTWAAQHVNSIMEVWFPGTEGGHALARVLYGEVAPSGKLPMSFPQTEGQEPLYYNQLPTGRPPYNADLTQPPGSKSRFISRYIDAPNQALFPFGAGLSYTTFTYSAVTLSRQKNPLSEATRGSKQLVIATATVKNSGNVAATEVVQCYVGNRGASLEQPIRSLQGFSRLTLAPAESKQVSFPLGYAELAFFNNEGKQIIEPTEYTVWVGGDSLTLNEATFRILR